METNMKEKNVLRLLPWRILKPVLQLNVYFGGLIHGHGESDADSSLLCNGLIGSLIHFLIKAVERILISSPVLVKQIVTEFCLQDWKVVCELSANANRITPLAGVYSEY